MMDLLEELAAFEHERWMAWSKAIACEVSLGVRVRWEVLWVPYTELPETHKIAVRSHAQEVLTILKRWLGKGYFYDGEDTG